MLSRLSILLSLVAVTAAANPTEPLGENSPRMWTVTLSASVDGSGVFHFSDEALKYKHKHWGHPGNVQLNGKPWQDLAKSSEDWEAHRGKLDLAQAWVVRREGRDTVAFEKTKTGFSVFLNDSPNGAGNYSITIAIPLLEQTP
ncbi:MAG: hypothetical protein NTZ32_26040 [Planctomycetales bacterium]|nr:hypothetical protein [Planctomycetales bacterium]